MGKAKPKRKLMISLDEHQARVSVIENQVTDLLRIIKEQRMWLSERFMPPAPRAEKEYIRMCHSCVPGRARRRCAWRWGWRYEEE